MKAVWHHRRASAGSGRGRRMRGLSMMEVLAAMVIFSSSAVVLFSWIGQTSDRLSKLELEQRRLFAELAALDYLRTLNPMQKPAGEAQLQQSINLSWHATPVADPEQVLISASAPGIYMVQLYKVEFQVQLQAARPGDEVPPQSLILAGWKQTAEVRRELPFQYQ